MKISYSWLAQHLSAIPEIDTLDSMLTQLGLEVESITSVGLSESQLQGLVVGEVVECTQHPNAERLRLTKVNIGGLDLLNIVCGAPNVAVGQKVVVATLGTTLYPIHGEPFKIKKSKIRGEESLGMLCAPDEIGLGESHDGIIVLPLDTPLGIAAFKILKFTNDASIEIGITPNHADACSHLGVARELRASMKSRGEEAEMLYNMKVLPEINSASIKNPIQVNVTDSSHCQRYAGLYMKDIVVQPSPEWLQNKLKSIGMKPINNIVDITNFVLHDIGQPIHIFDADKIKGEKIEVRLSRDGEVLKTLDGIERKLNGTELMICDAERSLAIAGVFGGMDSGVSASTQNIFIESAFFNPATVRKSARAHGLNTDASFRFERGTDPNTVVWALHYAAKLIAENAGGIISSEIIDIYPDAIKPFQINLRYAYLNQVIGKAMAIPEVHAILEALNIVVLEQTATGIRVEVPAYKNDVTTEIDLCEEVLRVYGLNKVDLPGRISMALDTSMKGQTYASRELLAQNLASKGYNEIMTNSLTKASYAQVTEHLRVPLLNPLSGDMGVMRDTMLFTGLEVVSYNLNRNIYQLQLFELGRTYCQVPKRETAQSVNTERKEANISYQEEEHCAIFITGKDEKLNALKPVTAPSFYHLKTLVMSLLQEMGVANFSAHVIENSFYNYALSFQVNNKIVATVGALKSSILKDFDVSQDVFYADLLLDRIAKVALNGFVQVNPVSKYPSVRRDLSLLIDNAINFEELKRVACKSEQKLLKEVGVFDIYKGDKLGEGKKSYALYFILQNEEKTLDDKAISFAMQKIQEALERELGAVVRS